MPDNSKNPEDKAWTELTSTLNEAKELTDRTFGSISNLASLYGGRINDKFQDSIEKDWYGFDKMIGTNFFKSWRDDDIIDNEKSSTCHHHGHGRGKLWAYPVPSQRQYNRCVENNGLSVWSRNGFWRCLFPDSSKNPLEIISSDDLKSPSNNIENNEWFSDYNVYLDWKKAMRKVEEAKREQEWQRIKEKRDGFWNAISESQKENETKIQQPGQSQSQDFSSPKFVSESDALKQGKNVISTSIISETISKDDGSLETKRIVKKWYDDNTVSVSETINSGDNKTISSSSSDPLSDSNSKSGWFWK